MLRAQRELDVWARAISPDTLAMTRGLVRDTDTLLRAYGEQIAAFADLLLSADDHQLSQCDVSAWRDEHFQRRDVMLSERSRLEIRE